MTATRTVLAAAVAVALVLAAAFALARWTGEESAGAADPLPDPPAGSRWVGMDGVVVAVPDWWTTGETQCGAPVEDTVYFDAAAAMECDDPADPATVREVSALAVLDGRCCLGEHELRSMTPAGDGEVVERAGCEEWFRGVCRRLFALPGTGVVFAVTIAEEGDGDYAQVRDSARRLPDGLTTVPLRVGSGFTPGWGTEPSLVDEVVRAVEEAGLVPDVERLRADPDAAGGSVASLPPGSLLEVSPTPGTVVEDGATVTLTVAD